MPHEICETCHCPLVELDHCIFCGWVSDELYWEIMEETNPLGQDGR